VLYGCGCQPVLNGYVILCYVVYHFYYASRDIVVTWAASTFLWPKSIAAVESMLLKLNLCCVSF